MLRGKGEPRVEGDVAYVPLLRPEPLDARLPPGDYLVVMSEAAAPAARPVLDRYRCVICVGPATARAVGRCAVPRRYSSEGVAELLRAAEPGRVVVARSDRGSDTLRRLLANVHVVVEVPVYRLVPRRDGIELAKSLIGSAQIVAVASAEVARVALRELGDSLRRVKLIAIGPEAARPLIEAGLSVAVAEIHTLDGLLGLAGSP